MRSTEITFRIKNEPSPYLGHSHNKGRRYVLATNEVTYIQVLRAANAMWRATAKTGTLLFCYNFFEAIIPLQCIDVLCRQTVYFQNCNTSICSKKLNHMKVKHSNGQKL